MSFNDFFRQFSTVHICMYNQDCANEYPKKSNNYCRGYSAWHLTTLCGQWSKIECTVGGWTTGLLLFLLRELIYIMLFIYFQNIYQLII